jgi:hypothetical protein
MLFSIKSLSIIIDCPHIFSKTIEFLLIKFEYLLLSKSCSKIKPLFSIQSNQLAYNNLDPGITFCVSLIEFNKSFLSHSNGKVNIVVHHITDVSFGANQKILAPGTKF